MSEQQRLPQLSQKCPWCFNYIMGDVATYNGDDPRYQGWMCCAECNLEDSQEELPNPDSQLSSSDPPSDSDQPQPSQEEA